MSIQHRKFWHVAGIVSVFAIALIWMIPFFWMLRSALMDMTQIFKYPLVVFPSPVRWENFGNALTSLPFFDYIRNSFTIVIACVAGIVIS